MIDREEITRRREALGLSPNRLASLAKLDWTVLAKIESGETKRPNPQTMLRIERALQEREREAGVRAQGSPESGLVEYRVDAAALGVRVFVKGPVADAEALEASVLRLMRRINDQSTPRGGDASTEE